MIFLYLLSYHFSFNLLMWWTTLIHSLMLPFLVNIVWYILIHCWIQLVIISFRLFMYNFISDNGLNFFFVISTYLVSVSKCLINELGNISSFLFSLKNFVKMEFGYSFECIHLKDHRSLSGKFWFVCYFFGAYILSNWSNFFLFTGLFKSCISSCYAVFGNIYFF